MKSMSPTEYEVLFVLLKLKKEKGINSATFNHICDELNMQRKQNKQKPLSFQLIYYYLSRLIKQPFVKKINDKRLAHYELKHGIWKLNQSPPLCIYIDDSTHLLLPCNETKTCRKQKPNQTCPPIRTMEELVKVTMPAVS